jgi:hypothetical protein
VLLIVSLFFHASSSRKTARCGGGCDMLIIFCAGQKQNHKPVILHERDWRPLFSYTMYRIERELSVQYALLGEEIIQEWKEYEY